MVDDDVHLLTFASAGPENIFSHKLSCFSFSVFFSFPSLLSSWPCYRAAYLLQVSAHMTIRRGVVHVRVVTLYMPPAPATCTQGPSAEVPCSPHVCFGTSMVVNHGPSTELMDQMFDPCVASDAALAARALRLAFLLAFSGCSPCLFLLRRRACRLPSRGPSQYPFPPHSWQRCVPAPASGVGQRLACCPFPPRLHGAEMHLTLICLTLRVFLQTPGRREVDRITLSLGCCLPPPETASSQFRS